MIAPNEPAHERALDETRHELKLTAERWELDRVRGWLRLHPAGFSTLYPPRQVNSVYFDTWDLDSYHDNLAGVPSRYKLRLRWYGPDLTRVTGTIELKRKKGVCGWKPQYRVAEPISLHDTSWPRVLRALRERIPPGWRHHLHAACSPVVLISYQREYYRTLDGIVRATVDYDLRAFDQCRFLRPNITTRGPVESRVILELKASSSHRRRLAEVAADFPLRTDRSSKYVAGVQAGSSY